MTHYADASTAPVSNAALTRRPVAERLRDVSVRAAELLSERGYAGFRLADLAAEFGITEAAVYRYVQGKDALVHMAFRAALYPALDPVNQVPAPLVSRRETILLAKRFLEKDSPLRQLRARLQLPVDGANAVEALHALLAELYRALHGHAVALRLIERIAKEWPELEQLWFAHIRRRFLDDFARWLERLMDRGALCRAGSPLTVAGVLVETVHQFALARQFEKSPVPLVDTEIEPALLHMLTRGLAG